MRLMVKRKIYYLPGQGGSVHEGLGKALIERGFEVVGRELRGDFQRLQFAEKIELVAGDLNTHCQCDESLIIANSMGAYLFLHAQLGLPPVTGKVLLLSPIVGAFSNEGIGIGFVPPRSKRLMESAERGCFPAPLNWTIHVGSEDWQCNPEVVTSFGQKTGIA